MAKREAGIAVRVHTAARGPVSEPDGFLAALEALPDVFNRTRPAIVSWTARDIAIVRRYYGRRRLRDIAVALGRTYRATKTAITRMRRRGELTPP
jgi:hypothetical protein